MKDSERNVGQSWLKYNPLRFSPGQEECNRPSWTPGLPTGFVTSWACGESAVGYACSLAHPLSGSLFTLGTVAVVGLFLRLKLDLTKEEHISICVSSLRHLKLLLWILPSIADIASFLLENMEHKTSFLLLVWFRSQRFYLWWATWHPKHFITSWRNLKSVIFSEF